MIKKLWKPPLILFNVILFLDLWDHTSSKIRARAIETERDIRSHFIFGRKLKMVSYSIIRNALLALLVSLLLFQLSYAQYHPECGESPAQRYREVAKQHGNSFQYNIFHSKFIISIKHARLDLASVDQVHESRIPARVWKASQSGQIVRWLCRYIPISFVQVEKQKKTNLESPHHRQLSLSVLLNLPNKKKNKLR